MNRGSGILTLLAFAFAAIAAAEPGGATPPVEPVLEDPVLAARYDALNRELRCLVCQNQSIADSHAALAVDLRHQVREMLLEGRSDGEIVAFMTDRYGDYVLYKPPFSALTLLLWCGPFLLLGFAATLWWRAVRRRAALPADAGEDA